jgi:hypothetical protein
MTMHTPSVLIFAQHPGINSLDKNPITGQKGERLITKIEGVALRENFFTRVTSRMGETTLFCLTGGDDINKFLEHLKNSLIKSREFADVTITVVTGVTAKPTLTMNEFLKG